MRFELAEYPELGTKVLSVKYWGFAYAYRATREDIKRMEELGNILLQIVHGRQLVASVEEN